MLGFYGEKRGRVGGTETCEDWPKLTHGGEQREGQEGQVAGQSPERLHRPGQGETDGGEAPGALHTLPNFSPR